MNSNQTAKNTRPFHFGKLFLWLSIALLVDFVLAFLIPIGLFVVSGFDIHGSIPRASGIPFYLVVNLVFFVYAASKGRESGLGFWLGSLLASLALWELLC